MYYIIETNYVGPNHTQDQFIDADQIEISTSPASTTSGGEWAVHDLGEYTTIEEARAAIIEEFGDVRDRNPLGDKFWSNDEAVIEVYKPGKFAPMGLEATSNWADSGIQSDIEADTSDERIDELVAKYEAEVNCDGYTLDSALKGFMQERRQELRDELEDEI